MRRSYCATCRLEQKHADVMSHEEALSHKDININHHVVVNPDIDNRGKIAAQVREQANQGGCYYDF